MVKFRQYNTRAKYSKKLYVANNIGSEIFLVCVSKKRPSSECRKADLRPKLEFEILLVKNIVHGVVFVFSRA